MTEIRAHFDGRYLVPDEPVDLLPNQQVLLQITPTSVEASDFQSWIGLANRGPQNPNPRFKSDDDLWKKG